MNPPRLRPRFFFPSATLALALAGLALLSGGCAAFFGMSSQKTERASSVVSYLYPGQANPLPPTEVPVLRLPLRVGIAFVPSSNERGGHYGLGAGLTEVQKTALMQRVADEFKGRDYIQHIEIIPSTYLRAGGGFDNLGQVRALLGVDVVALVAFDQVQFTSEGFLSLAYWTIVGAYIFQGNQNDTQTLMEAAVYDIASRHLLFRAPGSGKVAGSAAAKYLGENLRADSSKSFDLATTELIANLKLQLDAFRERVKQSPGEVKIEHRPGYTGGGALGGVFAGALALLGLARWLARRCA